VDRAKTLYTPKHVNLLATGHFISNNNLRFPQEPRGCVSSVRDVIGAHTGFGEIALPVSPEPTPVLGGQGQVN